MKPIFLNFIPDRRLFWVWTLCLATSAAVLVTGLASAWGPYQEAKKVAAEILHERKKMAELAARQQPPIDPRQKNALQVAQLLQKDLNPAFATIENVKQENARLASLSIDIVGDTARVEYTFESMAAGIEITEQLNAGNEIRPWKMQSMTSNASAAGGAGGFRGVWSTQLNLLSQ